MSRALLIFTFLLFPRFLYAEIPLFNTHQDYVRFVDTKVMSRDFIPLIKQLGGDDEYTDAQLKSTNAQLLNVMPFDFTGTELIKRVRLSASFSQEMRVFWNAQSSYVYFYAFLHHRDDGVVVLKFNLNTNPDKIFEKF